MSTIRAASWKDQLRVPTLDLGTDGKVIMPSNSSYSLVAEAPGKHIMGFISASLSKDEDTQEVVGFIDECRGNRLYEQMEPMVGLISEMEKILCREKVVCAIETRLPVHSSTKTFQMYRGLEYEATTVDGVVELGERMVSLRKNIRQEQKAAGEAQYLRKNIRQEQEAAGEALYLRKNIRQEKEATGEVCTVEAIVAHGARQEHEIRRASPKQIGTPEETEPSEASTFYASGFPHPDSQEEDELLPHQ